MLRDGEKIDMILCSKKLVTCFRILREEHINESRRIVKLLEALQDTEFRTAVYAHEVLLDPPQPIISQVVRIEIDPTILVGDVHETDHSKHDL